MAKDTKLYDVEKTGERVILVAVEEDGVDADSFLNELEELVYTAGAFTVGRVIQKREKRHPGHYVGKGKVEEIKVLIAATDATGIICDDELSPAQMRNLEEMLDTKVMDRTMLILDIFASRAFSNEGKIQVELAQLKYRLTRLSGQGTSLSRLGGGIGTRGPGEKKLESDKRYIKDRILELEKSLKDIQTHRELLRSGRQRRGIINVSLVGYTNAGKSTLLNRLTDAGVLAENKLFATLDTTTRILKLPAGTEILLTDTVGFIRKLPHHLIRAFRATLEEMKYADILLHVVDASNIDRQEQMVTVYDTLKELGCDHTPVITVYNKMDRNVELPLTRDFNARYEARISALEGNGIEGMLLTIEKLINSFKKDIEVLIPYSDGKTASMIYARCEIISEEHTETGIKLKLSADDEMEKRLENYLI
ncbi:MAG: GTPase HflX [Candidatus Metalachnospira sp.]|nr:GTPase HflX [Candidatus Metalachnospira sp.]